MQMQRAAGDLLSQGVVEHADTWFAWFIACAQASSYRHIRHEHLNNSLPYICTTTSGIHAPRCSLFALSGDKGDVHTWPEWHRGRPGIAVWVH